MVIKEDMATDSKSKKPKWDGKSRVSNDVYRKRWNEIFGNNKKEDKNWWNYTDKPKEESDANH
jgi:hypothetical protein